MQNQSNAQDMSGQICGEGMTKWLTLWTKSGLNKGKLAYGGNSFMLLTAGDGINSLT